MGGMAAGGFRDMTRLASGDPAMSHGIWRTNREAVIHWLERMSAEMLRFRDMLQDARDEDLLETFATAQLKREQFLAEPPRRVPAEGVARQVDGNKAMIDMLIGGMMADQLRRAQNIPELMRQELPDPPAKRGKEGEEPPAPAQGKKKMTLGDKLADDIRRDLEKLEKKRAEKADKEK